MTLVAIGLGSNLGDRARYLSDAARRLAHSGGISLQKLSTVYETPPWGDTDQPAFLNAALTLEADLPPLDLLKCVKEIEVAVGRTPSRRWGPREIDIDILFYGDIALESERLTLPHPYMYERAFVLQPLSELTADTKYHTAIMDALKELRDPDTLSIEAATRTFQSTLTSL